MECLICNQKIHPGEQIFWGNQMMCSGHGDYDCSYTMASPGIDGGIHLECMQSSVAATTTSCRVVPEPVIEESEVAVERSDALAMLGL